jgi:hypothetical protein
MLNTEVVSTKKPIIMFRVTRPEIRDALKHAARDDVRSVATMLEKIVGEWLADRGYLAKESDSRAVPKVPPKEKPQ